MNRRAELDTDVLIIGAGPVGLFGAYYAGFRGLRTVIVDSLSQPGGQISAMYPEKEILDVAGFPSIKGRELVDRLVRQVAPYDPTYLLGVRAGAIENLRGSSGGFRVSTDDGAGLRTKCVIVTGGIGNFTPRPLMAAGAFERRGMDYFVTRLEDYKDRATVIVGGGDSAFDWAHALTPYASQLTIVHRRDRFRAHAGMVETVRGSGVEILTESEVIDVAGGAYLERVRIKQVSSGEVHDRECQKLIAALGFTANLGPLLEWGLDIENRRHIVVDSQMSTNIPGIFSAGDIAEYAGKVRLIATGFGEVATAVNNAAVFIDPQQGLFPGHSTEC